MRLRLFIPDSSGSIERVLLTAWVGGMWVTGYVVAPLLFRSLGDRAVAGAVAGQLFSAMAVVALVCGAALLTLALVRDGRGAWQRWRTWVLVVMLTVTLVGEFVVAPRMQGLKQASGGVFGTSIASRHFAVLHGVSSSLFLANSLLGLVLVVAGVRRAGDQRGR